MHLLHWMMWRLSSLASSKLGLHLLCLCTVLRSLRCTQRSPYVVIRSQVAISSCREVHPIAHEPCLLSLLPYPYVCDVLRNFPGVHCARVSNAYFKPIKGVACRFALTCMYVCKPLQPEVAMEQCSKCNEKTFMSVPQRIHSNQYRRTSP